MRKLFIAYFGSPDFSADFLEKILLDKNLSVEIKLVVTQPDSLVGRKQILTPTPVKTIAQKYSLEILEINNLKLIKNLKLKISNLDLCFLYAYAAIIPQELLTLPKYGFWNIHPSLLPKYRGPSPIASPLINGDKITGATIIKMDEKIDHGPIIVQESLMIDQDDKRPDLEKKLTDLAFIMFKKILSDEDTGVRIKSRLIKQSDKLATYTKKLGKSDGFVEFKNFKFQILNSPEKLYNLFRGLYPWPGLWTLLRQGFGGQAKRLKITDLELVNGKLVIKKVQLEGKNEVDFKTFKKAYKIF